MLAIDTNVLVRDLLNDHPQQAAAARQVVDTQAVFVGDTVWLETDWVLRTALSMPKEGVVQGLKAFAGLSNVVVENTERLTGAFAYAEAGMGFADALHLVHSDSCSAFLTFDTRLINAARRIASIDVKTP